MLSRRQLVNNHSHNRYILPSMALLILYLREGALSLSLSKTVVLIIKATQAYSIINFISTWDFIIGREIYNWSFKIRKNYSHIFRRMYEWKKVRAVLCQYFLYSIDILNVTTSNSRQAFGNGRTYAAAENTFRSRALLRGQILQTRPRLIVRT